MYSQYGQPPRYAAAPQGADLGAHGIADSAAGADATATHAGLAAHFQQVHHQHHGAAAALGAAGAGAAPQHPPGGASASATAQSAYAAAAVNPLAAAVHGAAAQAQQHAHAVAASQAHHHEMNIGDPYAYGSVVQDAAQLAGAAAAAAGFGGAAATTDASADPYARLPGMSVATAGGPQELGDLGIGRPLHMPQAHRLEQHQHHPQQQQVYHQQEQQHRSQQQQGQMQAEDQHQGAHRDSVVAPAGPSQQQQQQQGHVRHQQQQQEVHLSPVDGMMDPSGAPIAAQAQQQQGAGPATAPFPPPQPIKADDGGAAAMAAVGMGIGAGTVDECVAVGGDASSSAANVGEDADAAAVAGSQTEEGEGEEADGGGRAWVCPRCNKTLKARCGLTSHLNHCNPEKAAQEAARDPQEKALKISTKRREGWEQKYQELMEFKRLNRHCRVPANSKCPEFPGLGSWVSAQRREYKKRRLGQKSQLTDDRVLKLVQLGFEWGIHETNWDVRFRDLLEYRRKYGNCDVPIKYKPNPHLSVWVARQRCAYKNRMLGKQSGMTDERIKALEGAGFKWSMGRVLPSTRDARFDERIDQLRAYREAHGHCNVPRNYKENTGLASWVEYQRYCHRHGEVALTEERRAKLEGVGFDWDVAEEQKQAKREARALIKQEKMQRKEEKKVKRIEEDRAKEEARKMREEKREAKKKAEEEKKQAREAKKQRRELEQALKELRKRKADDSVTSASKKRKPSLPKTPKTKDEVLAVLRAKREAKSKEKERSSASKPKSRSKTADRTVKSNGGRSARTSSAKAGKKATPPKTQGVGRRKHKSLSMEEDKTEAAALPLMLPPDFLTLPPGFPPPPWDSLEATAGLATGPKKQQRGRPRKSEVENEAKEMVSHLGKQKAAAAAAEYFAEMAAAWKDIAERAAQEFLGVGGGEAPSEESPEPAKRKQRRPRKGTDVKPGSAKEKLLEATSRIAVERRLETEDHAVIAENNEIENLVGAVSEQGDELSDEEKCATLSTEFACEEDPVGDTGGAKEESSLAATEEHGEENGEECTHEID